MGYVTKIYVFMYCFTSPLGRIVELKTSSSPFYAIEFFVSSENTCKLSNIKKKSNLGQKNVSFMVF